MIFPIFDFLKHYRISFSTWTLVFINIFWFLVLQPSFSLPNLDSSDYQWLSQLSLPPNWAARAPKPQNEVEYLRWISSPENLKGLGQWPPQGDEIEFRYRQKKIRDYLETLQAHPLYRFGFASVQHKGWARYFTYQFTHANGWHLVSNLILLLIFGSLLEARRGGVFVLGVYMMGGVAAALFYSGTAGVATAQMMVGASGSLSAIIISSLLFEPRSHLRFYYILTWAWQGWVFLPKWICLVFYVLGDLTQFLIAQNLGGGFSPVAYGAHIGGFLAGALVWVVLRPPFVLRSLIFGGGQWGIRIFP